MRETIRVRLTNEPKDENLKMNLLYHLPIARFPDMVDYLEKVAKKKEKPLSTSQE